MLLLLLRRLIKMEAAVVVGEVEEGVVEEGTAVAVVGIGEGGRRAVGVIRTLRGREDTIERCRRWVLLDV